MWKRIMANIEESIIINKGDTYIYSLKILTIFNYIIFY